MALQDPNIMPLSCSGCPMSLKTPNMGNPGQVSDGSGWVTMLCQDGREQHGL